MTAIRQVLILIVVATFAQACTLKPTKTDSTSPRKYSAESTSGLSDLDFSQEAVVVDARPSFYRSLGFIPGSVQVRWEDYTQREEAQKGVLQSDLSQLTRRLATLGISPQRAVTVLGRGTSGSGEEGRVAWMLAYLGVNKVQFADINSVKGYRKFSKNDFGFSPLAQAEQYKENKDEKEKAAVEQAEAATPKVKAVEPWEPQLDPSLLASREEVQFAISATKPTLYRGQTTTYKIIDVRNESEYHNRSGLGVERAIPNMGAVNIEWKEFLNKQGRPNLSIRKKLESVGFKPTDRIIVVSSDGVSSGEVTLCLRAMGFSNSANYSGGLVDLMSAYPDR